METIKGGEFLIKESIPENVFIPYEWDEEQKMIADGHNTLGSTVASAGSYLGSWLGSFAVAKPKAQSSLASNPKLQSA